MKNQTPPAFELAALLNRAAAAIETPGDLNAAEKRHVCEDLCAAADALDPVANPPAAGQAAQREPLHFTLRAIVALSENMIDDQDPKAVIDPVTVSEAARAIRQTANAAMKQAVRLHESHAVLMTHLAAAEKQFDLIAASLAQGHTVSISSVQNCAANARAALETAK